MTGVLSIVPVRKENKSGHHYKNMYPEEREYMLYLPLYDGLVSLSIGVDSLATISQPLVDYPIRKNPVVFMEPAFFKEVVLHVQEWHIPILYRED